MILHWTLPNHHKHLNVLQQISHPQELQLQLLFLQTLAQNSNLLQPKVRSTRSPSLQAKVWKSSSKSKIISWKVCLAAEIHKSSGANMGQSSEVFFPLLKQQQTCETFSRFGLKLNWLIWEQHQQVSCFLHLCGRWKKQTRHPARLSCKRLYTNLFSIRRSMWSKWTWGGKQIIAVFVSTHAGGCALFQPWSSGLCFSPLPGAFHYRKKSPWAGPRRWSPDLFKATGTCFAWILITCLLDHAHIFICVNWTPLTNTASYHNFIRW